jgi:hypothetical protein
MTRQETSQLKTAPGVVPSDVTISLPRAERSYRNVKEVLSALPEIWSSIERHTGWTLDLSEVNFQTVTAQGLQRRCLEDMTRRTGIPTAMPQSFVSNPITHALLSAYHRDVVALYLPSEKTIVLNEGRLRGMSQDAVKSTLHHELTHVAQHQRFPKFIDSVDRLAGKQRLVAKHGDDLPADERERQSGILTNKVQARMSLIEGQAMTLQSIYEREAGLHPERKIGPVEVALGLTSMLIPGGPMKIRQYIQGQAIFSRIHSLGVEKVDSLFTDPSRADHVFGSGLRSRESA